MIPKKTVRDVHEAALFFEIEQGEAEVGRLKKKLAETEAELAEWREMAEDCVSNMDCGLYIRGASLWKMDGPIESVRYALYRHDVDALPTLYPTALAAYKALTTSNGEE